LEPGSADALTLTLLADAQTSGGLVFGVEPGNASSALERLRTVGHDCAAIGEATAGNGSIRLR
ncbi:MAG: selenide, water dikinase SelD, partial [Sciscionella sp.]